MPQRYEITTTKNGQTILARVSGGVNASVVFPGASDSIDSVHEFQASSQEFASLMSKAATHTLTFDPKTKRVTATPKQQKPGKPAK